MIQESFQIPALAATVLALASFIIIPTIALNDRWEEQDSSVAFSSEAEGLSCALPPALDVEEGNAGFAGGPLPLDKIEKRILETATFALG